MIASWLKIEGVNRTDRASARTLFYGGRWLLQHVLHDWLILALVFISDVDVLVRPSDREISNVTTSSPIAKVNGPCSRRSLLHSTRAFRRFFYRKCGITPSHSDFST